MLAPEEPLALFLEGSTTRPEAKMALGVLRFAPNPVICAVDSRAAGRRMAAFHDLPRDCPVVGTLEEAWEAGARVLVLGTAPSGGRIPAEDYLHLDRAVELGFSLVNGLHDRLAPRYPALTDRQWIWDIRVEPEGIGVAEGRSARLGNRRVVMVGTDMAIGKMTAGIHLVRAAIARGVRAEFLATGQIGIVVTGSGVPLDAVKVDYACGAIESAMLARAEAELIVVEGQGAINHPGSTSTLPLLRGACPTDLVLCHRAGQTHLHKLPGIAIPPLGELIRLYEDLSAAAGAFPRPRTLGIALNTAHLDVAGAAEAVRALSRETGRLVVDPVRQGAEPLFEALETD